MFALFFWAVIGAVLATLGSMVLVGATAFFTRRRGPRKALLVLAGALPFCAAAWLGCVCIVQGLSNEIFLGRDFGLGDGFRCPLPHGYSISMIDDVDYASLSHESGLAPLVSEVRQLQIGERFWFGATESKFKESEWVESPPNTWFTLDIATGALNEFESIEQLSASAIELGQELQLEPVRTIYWRYRPSWFDHSATLVGFLPLVLGHGVLIFQIGQFRRTNPPVVVGP